MATTVNDLIVDFGEGLDYVPHKGGGRFGRLKMNGKYRVKASKITPSIAKSSGNGKLDFVLTILDSDEAGQTLYAQVVCTGTGGSPEKPRPNIFNLFQVYESAGKSSEDVKNRAKAGERKPLPVIAKDLMDQNLTFHVDIEHELQTEGQYAGSLNPRVKYWVTPESYNTDKESGTNRRDIDPSLIRQSTGGKTSASNGVTSTANRDLMDAALAQIA